MTLRAGSLRERVEIQDPPGDDDGAGGQTGGWTSVARVAASVVAIGGDEAAIAGIVDGVTRFRVTLRPRTVTTGQRLLWRGWQLDIKSELPVFDRGSLQLLCEGRRP